MLENPHGQLKCCSTVPKPRPPLPSPAFPEHWITLATGIESPTGMWALQGRNQVVFILYPHSPRSMLSAQLKLEWPWNCWGHLFSHEGLAEPQSWWVVQTLPITGAKLSPSGGGSGPDPVQMVGSRVKGRNGINHWVLCPPGELLAHGTSRTGVPWACHRTPRVFLQRTGY